MRILSIDSQMFHSGSIAQSRELRFGNMTSGGSHYFVSTFWAFTYRKLLTILSYKISATKLSRFADAFQNLDCLQNFHIEDFNFTRSYSDPRLAYSLVNHTHGTYL